MAVTALTEDVVDDPSHLGQAAHEGILSLLQQAARTVDQMWHSAQADGRNTAAVALGEASHGIHRALIALRIDGSVD